MVRVYANNSGVPKKHKSKRQREMERNQKKLKGKAVRGYVQPGTKDKPSEARKHNMIIKRQIEAAQEAGGKNTANVVRGLKSMLVREPIVKPRGTIGASKQRTPGT